jgi:hypothetical protein
VAEHDRFDVLHIMCSVNQATGEISFSNKGGVLLVQSKESVFEPHVVEGDHG